MITPMVVCQGNLKYIIPKQIPTSSCKSQSVSMYKWYSFLQRCSILIDDSTKIEDVFAKTRDVLAKMGNSRVELFKLFLNFQHLDSRMMWINHDLFLENVTNVVGHAVFLSFRSFCYEVTGPPLSRGTLLLLLSFWGMFNPES
jgi:hypothetical protein